MHYSVQFENSSVDYYLEASITQLLQLAPASRTVIITDEHVYREYAGTLNGYKVVTVPAGEPSKSWQTIERLIEKLIHYEAHRDWKLIGLGGGVVTDITGFVASVYMRGIAFGFVPTSLLGMVDAAIGGKNGVNVGKHKNMAGTISQPAFILYDLSFLNTLPDNEWSNGFAEIIKYGCIADRRILDVLKERDLSYYQRNPGKLSALISGCVDIKNKIVKADEKEGSGLRLLLNFGHTAGHAFETLYQLPHGHAVGLGMLVACYLSEHICGVPGSIRQCLTSLLKQYGLPVRLDFDINKVIQLIKMDKKSGQDVVSFILLEAEGKACVRKIPFEMVASALKQFANDAHY